MQNHFLKKITLLLGGTFFYYLFWDRSFGLNILIFSVLIITANALLSQRADYSPRVIVLLILTLATGTSFVYHGSALALTMHCISLLAFSCLLKFDKLRTPTLALVAWFENIANLIESSKNAANPNRAKPKPNSRAKRLLSILILPLLITVVFIIFYANGNQVFGTISSSIINSILKGIENFFEQISFTGILFFLLGIAVTAVLVLHTKKNQTADWASTFSFNLRSKSPASDTQSMTLKDQYQRALVTFVSINVLIALVNLIDFTTVWFDFEVTKGDSLKQVVHNGTYVLITSILFAISVILYFFKGELNNYRQGKWLKRLAIVWIGQNIILVISVGFKTFHYINFHGLAYKRIGVLIFLVIMVATLLSLFIKINRKKSLFFVFHFNSWAATIILVLCTIPDWSSVMVSVNLNHWNKGQIDTDFYFDLSPNVYPLLLENLPEIEAQIEQHSHNPVKWTRIKSSYGMKQVLRSRIQAFLLDESNDHWQSWQFKRHAAYKELRNTKADWLRNRSESMIDLSE